MRLLAFPMGILVAACTVVQPMASGPTPVPVGDYLKAHPHAALRVVDTSGKSRWFYYAEVRGDTLRGARHSFPPREEIALPLSDISEVGVSQFSAGRTAGLAGTVAAVLVVMALTAPKPVY